MYLNSSNYSDNTELLNAIEKEQKYLKSEIEIETQKGKTILENSNIILMNILSTHLIEGNELLARVNEMLDKTKENISLLNELMQTLNQIKVKDIISENVEVVEEYNKLSEKNIEQIVNNTSELENFNTQVSTYIKRIVYDKADIKRVENTVQEKCNENKIEEIKETEEEIVDSKDNNKLIISERDGKVYLPYKMVDIENRLLKTNKYKKAEEVINSEYVLNLDIFKNTIKSRFKEGFRLIKNKEKGSFVSAVKLGTELMFNYNLNPAIVAACKTESELESYLKCLQENKLDGFEAFDVEFEIAPVRRR